MGCRAHRLQDELIRIARADGGQLAVGRAVPGRGAWLCATSLGSCLDLAVRRKAFGRALRGDLATDATERLRGYLAERARL